MKKERIQKRERKKINQTGLSNVRKKKDQEACTAHQKTTIHHNTENYEKTIQ